MIGHCYIQGVEKYIKAIYVGVNGVAKRITRPSGIYKYDRLVPPLSVAREELAATTIGGNALFAGGDSDDSESQSQVDAYNSSLTRSTLTGLSVARSGLEATTVGNYALFAGGVVRGSTYKSTVDAYNSSLTRSRPTALSVTTYCLAATTVGNYALFAGGLGDTWYDTVDVYDKSLTKITPVHLSACKYGCKGATIDKKYALFFGGNIGDSSEPRVDAFDSSLVRTIIAGPNDERIFLAATTVGNYALFAGGYDYDSSPRTKDEVYAYTYEL